MVSNDPDFETKAADVIGLYLNPPAHAAVFCADEKTAIQALDRKDRMLPLSPGRAESHGFEYQRNGTLSLFAALNTATGEVLGTTAPRQRAVRRLRVQPGLSDLRSLSSATTSAATRPISSTCSWPSTSRFGFTTPHVLVMAQPGRELVLTHPARRDQPRRLHLNQGFGQEAHALHP